MEIIVAASNSSSEDKGVADYTCPATNPLTYITKVVLAALPTTGGTIKFLKGEYQASHGKDRIEIERRSNISLRGSPGAILSNCVGSYDNLICLIWKNSHISIEGFVIDGKILHEVGERGREQIYVQDSDHIEIRNNIIKNNLVGVAAVRSSLSCINNIFDTSSDEGICHVLSNNGMFERNTFRNCYGDCCIEVQASSSNNTFRNNIFENSRSGMLFVHPYPTEPGNKNNIITNNTFRKLARGAILMWNSEETEIAHNDFYDCATDTENFMGWDIISLTSKSNNNKIIENTIHAAVNAGCGIRIASGLNLPPCRSNSIINNRFYGSFLEAPICDYGVDTEITPAEDKRTIIFESYPQGATVHVLKRS